jgi:hypothetical protein
MCRFRSVRDFSASAIRWVGAGLTYWGTQTGAQLTPRTLWVDLLNMVDGLRSIIGELSLRESVGPPERYQSDLASRRQISSKVPIPPLCLLTRRPTHLTGLFSLFSEPFRCCRISYSNHIAAMGMLTEACGVRSIDRCVGKLAVRVRLTPPQQWKRSSADSAASEETCHVHRIRKHTPRSRQR